MSNLGVKKKITLKEKGKKLQMTRNYERQHRTRRHNMSMTEVAEEINYSVRRANTYVYKRKITGQGIVIQACNPSYP
jgi:hypothetical protein